MDGVKKRGLGLWPATMRVAFNAALLYVLYFKEPRVDARDLALVACFGCLMSVEHVRALARRSQ